MIDPELAMKIAREYQELWHRTIELNSTAQIRIGGAP